MTPPLALNDINTSMPGTITFFNPEEQTATVKIGIEKYYSGVDTTQMFEDFVRPEVEDVPVHFPQCKGFSLTMPVEVGDSCLIIFAQRGIGHWLYDNKEEAGRSTHTGWPSMSHQQKFEVNNALCIVGLNPIPKAIVDFNPTATEWRNADRSTRMTLLPSGDIEVVTPKTVLVQAGESVTIDTPLTTMTGNLQVDGGIHSDGDTVAGSVSLLGHPHNQGGDSAGNSQVPTDPPTPTA